MGGGGEGKAKRANVACRSSTSSSVGGTREKKVEGGSGMEDGASGQMSSSVCQGGIDALSVSWGPTGALLEVVLVLAVLVDGGGVGNGETSQSDSAAREMASRRFLRWREAAIAEDGNEGEEKEEEVEEVEQSELEDMFVVSFGDSRVGGLFHHCDGWVMGCCDGSLARYIGHYSKGCTSVCLFTELIATSIRCHAIL